MRGEPEFGSLMNQRLGGWLCVDFFVTRHLLPRDHHRCIAKRALRADPAQPEGLGG